MNTMISGDNANLMLWVTLGAGFTVACVAVGFTFWRRRAQPSDRMGRQLSNRHALKTIRRLTQWTKSMAEQMSTYGALVDSVARLFRNQSPGIAESSSAAATGTLLAQVVEANTQLYQRLGQAENMLKKQADELSVYMSEARTDTLTRLPNRRAFDEELTRRLAEWRRHGVGLSVLMVDVDHFKKVNDQYGHHAGDAILKGIADVLCGTVREADLVARLGGEEIAVILPGADARDAHIVAQRCRVAIERARFHFEREVLRVTASFGGASCLKDETGEQMMRRTDEALYAAKENGRNRAFWHDGIRAVPIGPLDELAADEMVTRPAARCGVGPDADDFVQICDSLRRRLAEVIQAGNA